MKRLVLKTFVVVFVSLLIVVGCGKKTPEPFTPNAKTDKCALCNMAVKDDHFATELILENGKKLAFDDLGCMNKWMNQNKGKKQAIAYVRDYKTNNWIEMGKATFVHDNEATKTPMAYNVISFENKKDAGKFVEKKKGTILAYNDLQEYSWERDPAALKKLMEMKAKREAQNGAKMENTGLSTK